MDYRYVPWYLELAALTHLTVITGIYLYGMLHDMTACQPHRFHLLCDPVTALFGRVKTVKIRDMLNLPGCFCGSENSEKKLLAMAMSSIFRTRPGLCCGAL
jgi:hypothetical protein